MKTEHKIMVASVAAGAFAWVLDALLDYIFFYKESFVQTLAASTSPDELYMRTVTVVYFLVFGFLMARTLASRQRAEESRGTLEETYRSIFDAANDAIFVHDTDTGEILDVNRKMCEMYGYLCEEVRRLNVEALSSGEPPYSQREALQLIHKAVQGEPQMFEWLAKDKSGRLFWVEVNLKRATIAGHSRLLAIVRDVGERKRTELALQEAEAKYRSLVEESLVGVYIIQDGRFKYVNPRLAEIFGYTQEEVESSKTVMDLVAPESREMVAERLRRRMGDEERSIRYSFQGLRKDGRVIDVEVHGARTSYLGRPAVIGSLLDITERKRAEESLRVTQFALDHAADPVEWIGYDARFLYVNEATCRALGYSSEELLNMTVYDIDPMVTRDDWDVRWTALRERGSITFESRHRRKDGHVFPVEITVNYFDLGGKEYICAFARDITERKQAEDALRGSYERERTIAQTLQMAFLPAVDLEVEGFAIHEKYEAALVEAEIGGDFYDVFNIGGGRVALVIGDVSGKGLKAASYTAMARYALRAYVHEDADPERTLDRLNKTLSDYMPQDLFITLFYGVLDPATHSLSYGSAGHEPPLVYRRGSNTVVSLEVTGCAVGAGAKCGYTKQTLQLEPGDVLLAYTDGITEARMNGQLFGMDRLIKTLIDNSEADERVLADAVFESARQFSGGALRDDAAVLVVRRKNQD
ncbi:MAG: PAS domain S-box protein [Armatimonadota bacterium]|nr:PAS domain S-box protein [Armatimonadota bacterium]